MKLILAIAILILLQGCNKNMREAQGTAFVHEKCDKHLGVQQVSVNTVFNNAVGYCNDGTRVSIGQVSQYTSPEVCTYLKENR